VYSPTRVCQVCGLDALTASYWRAAAAERIARRKAQRLQNQRSQVRPLPPCCVSGVSSKWRFAPLRSLPSRPRPRRPRLWKAESGKVRPVASGLEIEQLLDTRGVRLAGDLDFSTAPRFTEAVSAFAPGDELHIDLAELILVDSAGLHAVLGLARTRANRSLILLDPPASVMRSFEIAGIDKHPAIEIRQAGAASVPRRTRKTSPRLRRAG
jgi:anti-anti-sigma factor